MTDDHDCMKKPAQVKDIMSRRPVTVRADATIAAAGRLLARHHVTALPVVDGTDRAIGMISEADLFARSGAGTTVRDLMTSTVVQVRPDTDLDELGRVLSSYPIKSVPVVDPADRVVGMVSRSDVVGLLDRDDEVLEDDVVDALVAAGFAGCRVHSHNGVLDLSVGARDDSEVRRIVDLAAAVPGVTAVHAG